ncbi:hypothetical protein FA048_17825 [Pedobacter polaris]|uniref:Uncharacterized protein n=2 Tax=Pedobacter polaris TaxID=2571273 RepID=A0A4U1CGF6_9SPHI|nr:hypothetical protein FA048_17825 [Pedobacter polaris]
MLQNRVDPFGNLITTKARGKWLGNRGQLHGTGKTILRPFKHKAWISCELVFKGRRRVIMSPNLWTELFFLDEATALAAGHRPCFECRRIAANLFKAAWLKGNPEYGFNLKTKIGAIDKILHRERIDEQGKKVTFQATLKDLPTGTFISIDNEAYLVVNDLIYQWSPFGYAAGKQIALSTVVKVLTPKSIMNALKSGYQPQLSLIT